MNRKSIRVRTCVGVTVALLLCVARDCEAKPGFYSVAEIDGVWWFTDPQGKPFYSLGVSDIGPGPPRDKYDPARPAYAAFQHYDSTQKWAEHTIQRLTDWNFNTLGGWADPALTGGSLPYSVVLHMGSQVGFPWNDVFAADFAGTLDEFAKLRVRSHRRDTNLLGWYSDNEQGWYPDTLLTYHSSQPASSKTRAKLIELLRDEYKTDFAALERDFEVIGAATFDDLMRGGELRYRLDGDGRGVVRQFAAAIADRYYRVVHDAIRRYDPNHLILGDRYAWHCPDVVAKAAAPYVDVISTNLDWPEATDGYLPTGYLRNLHRLTGKPVLVTEYYVAARENRSGNKNTGGIFLTVDTQEDRTAAVEQRLRCLARQPYVVGAHWFRFADEPTHGRAKDGEDYNFGLVDIDNRPYDGLTAAMSQLNADVPRLHRERAKRPGAAHEPIAVRRLTADASDLHGQLTKASEIAIDDETLQAYEVLAAWDVEKLYLVALIGQVVQPETYSSKSTRREHFLEVAITSPAFDRPVTIPLPKVGGVAEIGGVECRHLTNGLRHTLVVAIPPKTFGKGEFDEEDEIPIGISINDLLNGRSTRSQFELKLAHGEGLGEGSKPADSAGQ